MTKLSTRETQILKLISKGLTDKEIAVELKISIRTVQTHINRLLLKLNARNRANAVTNYFSTYGFSYI